MPRGDRQSQRSRPDSFINKGCTGPGDRDMACRGDQRGQAARATVSPRPAVRANPSSSRASAASTRRGARVQHQPRERGSYGTNQNSRTSQTEFQHAFCFLIVAILIGLGYRAFHSKRDFSRSGLNQIVTQLHPMRVQTEPAQNERVGSENGFLSSQPPCASSEGWHDSDLHGASTTPWLRDDSSN